MSDVRGGDGRYAEDPKAAERDARAADLRSKHWTYTAIASDLGYSDASAARKAVQRAMQRTVQEAADEVRAYELDRLDRYARKAEQILEKHHLAHSAGRLIVLNGEPVTDDGPVLAALDRLLKIQDRRARLLGLDAPTKVEATVRDATQVQIEELAQQLGMTSASVPSE